MREIKFRGWNKTRKLFDDDFYIYFIGGAFCFGGNQEIEIDDLEVTQFTGLKDKNGVEIYEGDIVEHSIHLVEKPILKQILFYEGSFIAKPKHDGSQSYMSMIHFNPLQTMRVIGNIYENPELLEK